MSKILKFWDWIQKFQILCCDKEIGRKEEFVRIPSQINFYKIASQFKPVVKLLQLEGGYLISELQNKEEDNYKSDNREIKSTSLNNDLPLPRLYDEIFLTSEIAAAKDENLKVEIKPIYTTTTWKYTWRIALYSYVYKALTLFALTTFVCNIVFNIPFPARILSLGSIFYNHRSAKSAAYNRLSLSTLAVIKLIEMIVLYFNCKTFVCWLNKWSNFERDFWNCFKVNYVLNFNIRKLWNMLLTFYIGILLCAWEPGRYVIIFPFFNLHVPFLSWTLLFLTFFLMWGYALTEDCKTFIILRSTKLVLEQIRNGIKVSIQNGIVKNEDVFAWRRLIEFTRQQTALACSYMKTQQLLSLAETVISCSLSFAAVLEILADGGLAFVSKNIGTIAGPLYLGVNSFGRLYAKALLGEKIPEEELRIAEVLLELDAKCEDVAIKSELKFLYNMLTQSTVTVNLGNYVSLDKKLLLTVGSQVVTYLIVIMQFR